MRKTANEYYLAAAGLPDPLLLPRPTDRAVGLAAYGFAIINVMDNVNLELQRLGIAMSFTVQAAAIEWQRGTGRSGHRLRLCGPLIRQVGF